MPKWVPPAPRGQGEISGIAHSSPAQAQTCASNVSHTIVFSHRDDQSFAVRANCDQDVVVGPSFGDGVSKINNAVVGVGGERIEANHVRCCKKSGGEQELVRKLGSKEEEQEISITIKLDDKKGELRKVIGKIGKGRTHRRTSEECWELRKTGFGAVGLTTCRLHIGACGRH